MESLKKIKSLVKKELENNPATRKNDMYLYLEVCEKLGVNTSESFLYLVCFEKLPNPETVRRARQKVQAEHPEWKDEQTAENRANLEPEYIKVFAR